MLELHDEVKIRRPDEDIAEDIAALIRRFPPLMQSRHWFAFSVKDGVVTVRGHIKSAVGMRVLLDNLPDIPGVESVDASELYNDDDLRRAVGRVIPPGVRATVDFGHVLLTGTLPPRHKVDALLRKVEKVPGVRRVSSNLT